MRILIQHKYPCVGGFNEIGAGIGGPGDSSLLRSLSSDLEALRNYKDYDLEIAMLVLENERAH